MKFLTVEPSPLPIRISLGSPLTLLLSMLLISRSMELWNTCFSSMYSIDKTSFPSILIFRFLLQLPISSSVFQIIKELCSSSSYSFHFRHLSFIGIMKEAISSQNMTYPVGYVEYYLEVPSSLLYIQVFVHYLLSLVILSPLFSSSNTFQSSPNTSAPIFLVSRSLSHIKQCSKHNT